MANFHGFEPRTPSGRLSIGGSGWILASKAHIHYGPWLLCPDEPQEGPKLASKWQIFMVLNPFKVLLETFRGHIKVF